MASSTTITSDEQWGKLIQSKTYWNKRYESDYKSGEKIFEWYLNFDVLETFVTSIISSKDDNILELGCGNSTLSNDLSKVGYTSITSIDYSDVAIEQQKKNYPTNNVNYLTVDATNMSKKFKNNKFDCIMDKATLDSMMSGDEKIAIKMIKEICNILKNKGTYIIISHVDPETEDGHHLLYNIIIKNLLWTQCRYTIDIHSSSEMNDDDDNTELPHIYQIKQLDRPSTRRQKKRRKLNSMKNEHEDFVQITETIQLPFSIANELILRQHFH